MNDEGLKKLISVLCCLLGIQTAVGCGHWVAPDRAVAADPLSVMVAFYRGPLNHLQAVRRGTTPMYPATSAYSLESIQKHGPLMGTLLTCDRLLRAGRDELQLAPHIVIGGRAFSYDPVDANDFWWHSKNLPVQTGLD